MARLALALLDKVERAGPGQRRRDIEAPGIIGHRAAPLVALGRAEASAGAGVGDAHFPLRRAAGPGDLGLDLAPGAEARVQQPLSFEAGERVAVIVDMLGLAAQRPVPGEAEPGEVLDDRVVVFGAAAGMVDVLNPQQEAAAGLAGRPPPLQCRADMSKVQIAGRARREAGDDGAGERIHARLCCTSHVALASDSR